MASAILVSTSASANSRPETFDINAAIPAAWKLIWEHKAKAQAEEGGGYRDSNMHCTASDVENQVRQFADDDAHGRPRGTMAWGRPYSMVRITCARGRLDQVVRDWLLDEVRRGRIDSHNFGRHHISGMRFRPHGAPLSLAETKTIAKNIAEREAWRNGTAKPKPTHWRKGGGPLCTAARRSRFSFGRSNAHLTSNQERVTCPRCAKLLAAEKPKAEATA